MGCRGSGRTRYSGELVARAAGNIVLQKDTAASIGQYAPVSCLENNPLPDREAWQATVHRVIKSWTLPK